MESPSDPRPHNDAQPWDDWGPPYIYMARAGATPLEAEITWLEIVGFLTIAWALLGATAAGLTIALAGTLWGCLWFTPCAAFALATIRQLITVGRMVNGDDPSE